MPRGIFERRSTEGSQSEACWKVESAGFYTLSKGANKRNVTSFVVSSFRTTLPYMSYFCEVLDLMRPSNECIQKW
jgi:hypothetical protein